MTSSMREAKVQKIHSIRSFFASVHDARAPFFVTKVSGTKFKMWAGNCSEFTSMHGSFTCNARNHWWLIVWRHDCHFQSCPCLIDSHADSNGQDLCHEGTGVKSPSHGCYFTMAWHMSVIFMWDVHNCTHRRTGISGPCSWNLSTMWRSI